MEGEKGKIFVIGGTSFIASWLIMRLLQQGYIVHTTIRTHPEQKRDISFLTRLPRATERLKIFIVDLEDPNSFDIAIEGCKRVFHLATPMDLKDGEPSEVVTDGAINGTLGILKACLKIKRVRQVVYTSSASSIFASNKCNEVELLESMSMALALVYGKSEEYIHLLNASMVHVDDVAMAQIFLLEQDDDMVSGRYICSSHTIMLVELSQVLSTRYPEFVIPSLDSLAKVQSFKLAGVEELLDDAIKCCEEKGHLK
ncbi:hypothetical protein SLE2022_059920 [Rubroshorea leprosula]